MATGNIPPAWKNSGAWISSEASILQFFAGTVSWELGNTDTDFRDSQSRYHSELDTI